MRRAPSPGQSAVRTSRLESLAHRIGFWVLDGRERLSSTVRWPLHLAARLHRRWQPGVPLVTVTGSTGKTTTQRLIAHILATRYAVIATDESGNSDTRYPRHVLRSRSRANHALVLECGIQRPGNAARFNRGLDPDVLVVTNIGDTHLTWLGSRQGVLAEKIALAERLKPGGTVLLNADDPLLAPLRLPHRVRTFAVASDADFRALDVRAGADGLCLTIAAADWRIAVRSCLLGPRNAYALVAAAACASLLGVDPDAIAGAIETFAPSRRRLGRIERSGFTILDDTYSASPDAVLAGLEALAALPGRPIAVLGDMMELGDASPELHRELGREIARRHPSLRLITYGGLAERIGTGAREAGLPDDRIGSAASKIDLLQMLHEEVAPGDVVLVKGSRGMRMDQVVAGLGEPPYATPLAAMARVRPIGAFGAQRSPDRRHQGIDLPTPLGTPVHAFAAGEVVSARFEPGYGKVLRLRHFTNVETVYAHLSRFDVRRGPVARGQRVAQSGRSGILHTGSAYDYPHLHFEVRVDGQAIDPTRYFPAVAPPESA